jgi:ferric-dicitrate binding protein FerR (iron transport regulator)
MDQKRHHDEDDLLARLIQAAGPRKTPPQQAYDQAFATAREAWQSKVRQKKWRTWSIRAAAAVLVAGVIGAFIVDRTPRPGTQVAQLERTIGSVQTRVADDMNWNTPGEGTHGINVRNQLRTGAGSRAAVRLADNVSVRLADSTEVVFDSARQIRLKSGTVYVDTGAETLLTDSTPGTVIEIVSTAGVVRDIGTQFEVRYRDEAWRLRVREGRVVVERESGELNGSAGEQLDIDAEGRVGRARVARDDAEWQWVESIAPTPDIEDQPVTVLLAWVSRETGRRVRYAQPDLQDKAARTILHGNIRYLPPMEALDVMLATTDLAYDVDEDGTILIRLKMSP